MGYRFIKKGAPAAFYIRLRDASVVRAVASIEALDGYMPRDAPGGELIPPQHIATLARTFREQACMLSDLATYFEGAVEELKWDH
jgi:hypothetical protein